MVDSEARRTRLLTQPFEAGLTGWIVVLGAVLAELIGGAVTNHMSTPVVATVLGIPAAVALGFAVAQWWQVRSSRVERPSWFHLAGIAAALLAWGLWPTRPGVLDGSGNAASVCRALGAYAPLCLPRAARAVDNHDIAWWGTAVLILLMALLIRRSRIAAWAAIPVAFAGVELATHFMEQLLLFYNAGG